MRFRARGWPHHQVVYVGTAAPSTSSGQALGLSGGAKSWAKPRRALSATIDETKTRRTAFAWTAEGGCRYVGFAFSCKLTRDETSPFPGHCPPAALLDPR